eukprot:Em0001g2542a
MNTVHLYGKSYVKMTAVELDDFCKGILDMRKEGIPEQVCCQEVKRKVVCLLAAILVLRLKLYKTLVYRLALYQVLSALAMASVGALQDMRFINYDESSDIYRRICTAIVFLEVYTEWTKLLFTTWVTFHLFCFAVFHKNMKKLEALYVVTSLLVPALIAALPLVTQTYGSRFTGSTCYIQALNGSVASIERIALGDGPAMFILIAASTTMVVMVIKLASQVYRTNHRWRPVF